MQLDLGESRTRTEEPSEISSTRDVGATSAKYGIRSIRSVFPTRARAESRTSSHCVSKEDIRGEQPSVAQELAWLTHPLRFGPFGYVRHFKVPALLDHGARYDELALH